MLLVSPSAQHDPMKDLLAAKLKELTSMGPVDMKVLEDSMSPCCTVVNGSMVVDEGNREGIREAIWRISKVLRSRK